MKFHVIEHYKGESCGSVTVCDTKVDAEKFIDLQFEHNPGVDYKTTFTIEERDD